MGQRSEFKGCESASDVCSFHLSSITLLLQQRSLFCYNSNVGTRVLKRVGMKKLVPRTALFLIIFVVLCFLLALTLYADELATIASVVDGDTLVIDCNGRREPIQLLGIDAPECTMNRRAEAESRQTGESLIEIASKGIDAKRFLESIVKKGDVIVLAFDVETRTRGGALLGYVYLSDGRMLNEIIVSEGYATVRKVLPNVKYHDRLLQAYKEARTFRRGLWKSS